VSGAEDCPFCEIVQREDPDAREVYRDEHVVAFFPTEPAVLGHTMVVPREHVPDIWSLSDLTWLTSWRFEMPFSCGLRRWGIAGALSRTNGWF